MFHNENDNINYSEFISTEFITFQGEKSKGLTPPDNATRAKLQCYLDEQGIKKVKPCKLSYTPILSITQSGQDIKPGYASKTGIKLLHLETYELRAIKNLSNARLVAFQPNVICYCIVEYFK
jgi:hypothetical protein